jgi:hypothetical protein
MGSSEKRPILRGHVPKVRVPILKGSVPSFPIRAKWLSTALLAGYIGMFAACQSSTDPPPPPPPTKYKHSLKVEAGKTLHYGQPVTGGTFRVTMENTGTVYPPITSDAATLGTTLNLAETTTQQEPCTIIMYPKVMFDNDCQTREYRTIPVTNNTLRAENVIFKADVDWTYLLNDVLTKKDNMGRNLNTSWEPRILNASSNPDQSTGLRLDLIYIEGLNYGPPLGIKGIKPALLDFQEWGKRYVGTPFEEVYITSVINFVDANNPPAAIPSDGDFQAFRTTETSGVSNISYPLTEVKVLSSKELVNQSSADPFDAYKEAIKALMANNMTAADYTRFKTCVPVLMWRPRDSNEYWITLEKESQKGVDNLSTTIQSFAQEYVYLEGASNYYNNVKFGAGSSVDYTPGVPHWTKDHPLREAIESGGTKESVKR